MGPSYFFDKSMLSLELQERQKSKKTFDSPCLSVCDYDGEENVCQTCQMLKREKSAWKVASAEEKEDIAKKIKKRAP